MKVLNNLLFDFHNDCIDINGDLIQKQLFTRQEAETYKTEVLPFRLDLEKDITRDIHRSTDKKIFLDGYSETASAFVRFDIDLAYSDGQSPNFRERLVCPITRLNNRQRFICNFTKRQALGKGYRSIFIHEQSTPVYRYLSSELENANILGAEFLGLDVRPGQIISGLRHEDLSALTFDSDSFDMMLSCDVLPKIPDLQKAVTEISRVIKEGGMFIFSIPFSNEQTSRIRARIEHGSPVHLVEPGFYHNPHTGRQDELIFHDIGWDLFDALKKYGFKNVYQLAYYSATFGYLGEGCQSIFVAEK